MNRQILATVLATVFALSATTQLLSDSKVDQIGNQWSAWKSTHGKSYTTEEEAYRFAVFTAKLAYIEDHNSQQSNYKVGLNQFSDLTNSELKSIVSGYKPVTQTKEFYVPKNVEVPSSIDWRTKGAVTPVKNQGQCGSCWAFGTVGGIEGSYAVATGNLVSFSEQQIVSCDTSDDGCGGGNLGPAYDYVNGAGLQTESSYPYTSGGGSSGYCQAQQSEDKIQPGAISGSPIQTDSPQAFQQGLVEAPLSICIDAANSAFSSYTSGVLDSGCGTSIDHCVTAVGYDNSASVPYVIVKNSWGTSWGNQGYILIGSDNSYQQSGVCGIYSGPYHANYSG